MVRALLTLLSVAVAIAAIAADSMAAANYVIFSQRFSADPAPIVHDGRVYLYTSHDKDHPHGYDMQDWNCLSSSDMTNWRDEGIAFSLKNTTWAQDLHAWAQQVVALKNGSFVMYFPAMGTGGGVGVATASHPAGPFVQATDGPLNGTDGADDPTVFVDDDDRAYVCVNKGGPLCGELNEDLVSWKSPPQLLPGYDHGDKNGGRWHYFEAPWLMRHGDQYILSYMMSYSDCPGNNGHRIARPNCSWSHGGFDVGYAVAPITPAGPLAATFAPQGTLMWSPPTGFNNHQGICEFPAGSGEFYMFYHSCWFSNGDGLRRNVGVDRLYYNDSRPLAVAATPGWLRPVQFLDPSTARVPAFTMADATDGVKSRPSGDDASMIGDGVQQFSLDMAARAWTHIRQVDFGGGGHTSLSLRVNAKSAAVMSLHLDSLSAQPSATCTVAAAAEWMTVTCALPADNALRGVHDLWIMVQKAANQTSLQAPSELAAAGCLIAEPVCYSDNSSTRTLSSANPGGQAPPIGKAGPITPEFCAWQCHQLNFSLAGTEYRTECYCGNALSGQPTVLTADHCAMPCSGKTNRTASAETCGGFKTMSVFKVACTSAVPTPCYPNGTVGPPPPPPPPTPIVAFAWWQLHGGAQFALRTPPKTMVPVNISISAPSNAQANPWMPVAVLGNKLVAHGTEHATIVLVDNEDGTYALQVGAFYACATAPSGGGHAELVLSAKIPTQACARFRIQVIKDTSKIAMGNHFAFRSAAVGLWVSACTVAHTKGECPLTVTTANPLMDRMATFTVAALHGDQLPPPH